MKNVIITNNLVDFLPNVFSLIFTRGGFRTTAASKMERFVIVVKGWKPLTIIKKRSILDIAAVLDPPLFTCLLNV